MRARLKPAVLLLCLWLPLSNCSVYLTASRPPVGSPQRFALGVKEGDIERLYGPPKQAFRRPDGMTAIYLFDPNERHSERHTRRAALYAVADVLLGLLPEIPLTLYELWLRHTFQMWELEFDARQRLQAVTPYSPGPYWAPP